jgi:hypothetical protein
MNEQEQKLLQKYGKLPAKKSMLGGMKVCIMILSVGTCQQDLGLILGCLILPGAKVL